MTSLQSPTGQDSALELALTGDALSALMRSTWTWDDRALRHDLAALLVDISAAGVCPEPAMADVLRARALHNGAHFAATVLGPKLIADTGNPFRSQYADAANDPAHFGRLAATARRDAVAATGQYLSQQVNAIDYPVESAWRPLVSSNGTEGLATAMRAYGHNRSDSAFFASFGLAWQMLTTITRSEQAAELARRLVDGEITATLAAAEQTGSWDPVLVRTRATQSSGEWRLDGTKHFVPSADRADVLLVIGRSIAGPSVFAVDRSAPGLSVTAHAVSDPTRPLFEVSLTDTPATLLGREGGGGRFMFEALGRATTALAGEQVGLIEVALATLADQADADVDLTDAALHHTKAAGMWRQALETPTPEHAAMAHIAASASAVAVAEQLAETVGSTAETDAIQRRAISGNLLFGGPALSHERLLERLGI